MNNEYTALSDSFNIIYNTYKFKRKSFSQKNKRHHLFNLKLYRWLKENQANAFLPSKECIENMIVKLYAEVDEETETNSINNEREDACLADHVIKGMDYLPIKTEQDEKGELLPYPYLKIYGIISVNGINKTERNWIEKCFNAPFDDNYGAITVLLMSVPISNDISEQKQEKINKYCQRIARNVFRRFMMKEHGLSTGFNYKIKDKIMDYILDGSI